MGAYNSCCRHCGSSHVKGSNNQQLIQMFMLSLPVHTEAKLYYWSAFNGFSDYAGGILELQKQVGLIEGCTRTLCSCAGAPLLPPGL